MDQNQPELTLEESIKQVMQTLPPVIRDYLAAGRYTTVARSLALKYNLRIDQAGVLERELMLLLMGIENPAEFTEALSKEAGLDQQAINGIVQDVNAQVFVPLREQEMKASRPAPAPAPAEVKPPQPVQRFMHLDNKIPPPVPPVARSRPIAPVRATQGAVQNPGLRSVLAGVTSEVKADRLLEDREEPHIEFNTTPTPPAPVALSVPQNLPGAIPPQAVPEVRPSPVLPKVEPPKPVPPPAPAKPYSVDPYREPIE